MTKEKIIDGVKVEECSYYNKDNTPYCCEVWDNECEAQNCYFKQCKRLEQREKQLVEQNFEIAQKYTKLEQENNLLKQTLKDKNFVAIVEENERLKTQYNCYACGNCKGKEDYINLEKHHIRLRKQFDKKVQTLQEIKTLAENNIHIEDAAIPTYNVCKLIIQNITKAEEE